MTLPLAQMAMECLPPVIHFWEWRCVKLKIRIPITNAIDSFNEIPKGRVRNISLQASSKNTNTHSKLQKQILISKGINEYDDIFKILNQIYVIF
jgi:hypothetical protein